MRTLGIKVIPVLLAMLLAAGCRPSPPATQEAAAARPAGERLGITAENYPKVDGSTSARPLAQFVAGELLGLQLSSTAFARPYRPGPDEQPRVETRVAPTAPEPGEGPLPVKAILAFQQVRHRGTHQSYVRLVQGEADLILVARLPSEDELNSAAEKGVELEAKPVALDAFIFIVNQKNSVDSLTMRQIQDIYTGKIENWSEVGAGDAPLTAYQRERNSGSQELMLALVMKDLQMINAPDMITYTMMGPIDQLSRDPNGLGYSVYYYEKFMAPNPAIKVLGVDGIHPGSATIAAREYPLTTEVHAVIRKDLDENSTAYKLRDWLLTPDGQKVVAKSGYVPITPPAPS